MDRNAGSSTDTPGSNPEDFGNVVATLKACKDDYRWSENANDIILCAYSDSTVCDHSKCLGRILEGVENIDNYYLIGDGVTPI
jgi:hypothetical protein